MDQSDWHRVQKVQLLTAAPFGAHQFRRFKHSEMLHDSKTRHGQSLSERTKCLPVLLEQFIQQAPARGISKCLE